MMRGGFLGLAVVGAGVVLAGLLWWGGRSPEVGGAEGVVVVVPSGTPMASAPAPAASPAAGSAETVADAAAIEPYRAVVRKALGLDGAAVFRGVIVADARQDIVCGEVRKGAAGGYQPFVFVGGAGIAALDDGTSEFKGMQKGACGVIR